MARTFAFNGVQCVEYVADKAGDELPLHSHTFNHLTLCTEGVVECFTADGASVTCTPTDPPVEYIAGRKHGIRGLSDGARFLNISPVLP